MKKLLYLFLALFFSWLTSYGQVTYQGPEPGNITSGVVKTTDEYFSSTSIVEPIDKKIRNKIDTPSEPFFFDIPAPPEDALLYIEDTNREMLGDSLKTVLLKDFAGNPMGNSIPPDPHIAVGPNHIITTVNTSFRIYDKQGNLLKDITADSWNSAVLPNPDSFDPQIMYDHYAGRWIMLWDNYSDVNFTAYFFLSVSDDDDPLGTWYLWALPAHQNGNFNAGNWGDYPGIGFDQNCLYILSRQFHFTQPILYYNKIRIISKAELYASQGTALSWKDIWDISYPTSPAKPDGIRPCLTYGNTTDAYFLHTERGGGNAINLFKITDPLNNPVLSGNQIIVPFYYAPPNANQLGGGSPAIASNGANLMMAPRLFNGHMYVVHAISNPQHSGYSAIRYMKINPLTATIVEDFAYGAQGYFYLFPALDLDKDGNAAVNFSRSGDNEYAGAFYTSRLASDPPGFNPSYLLRPGGGNYVVTYGGTRNRWGDYHGMYRDPIDQNNFWMLTEYAHSTNKWGTWVGNIRLIPFPGAHVFTRTPEVDFGSIEINTSSNITTVKIKNYGENNLVISDIPQTSGPFQRVNNLTFPITLVPYTDSLTIDFKFAPTDTGHVEELFAVTSNSTNFQGFLLKGKGYQIITAVRNLLYASSGSNNNGYILSINPFTGEGTPIGPSLYTDIKSIAIHPTTNVMYGIYTGGFGTHLLRVNAEKGDAYYLNDILKGDTLALPDMFTITFDNQGVLYGIMKSGDIYEINPGTGTAELKSTLSFQVQAAAVNPLNNEVWVSVYVPVGSGKDKIYKVNLETGAAVLIGNTGLNVMTNSLIFDGAGELYGTTGNSTQISKFISIDTTTAAGTEIGPVEYIHITGLAYYGDKFTGVNDGNPAEVVSYSLEQNYPNPFNPSTTITYSLPSRSSVALAVYNMLGEKVKTLVSGEINAGYHTTTWNGDDQSGTKVSSGVYFYELKASSPQGEKFTLLKKMILMK